MSEKEDFKEGDIVYLKTSGHPAMVIDYFNHAPSGECNCVYSLNDEVKVITLHLSSLTKTKPSI